MKIANINHLQLISCEYLNCLRYLCNESILKKSCQNDILSAQSKMKEFKDFRTFNTKSAFLCMLFCPHLIYKNLRISLEKMKSISEI